MQDPESEESLRNDLSILLKIQSIKSNYEEKLESQLERLSIIRAKIGIFPIEEINEEIRVLEYQALDKNILDLGRDITAMTELLGRAVRESSKKVIRDGIEGMTKKKGILESYLIRYKKL